MATTSDIPETWVRVSATHWVRSDGRALAIYDPAGFWCWSTYAGGNHEAGAWERGRFLETVEAAMTSADIQLGEKRGRLVS